MTSIKNKQSGIAAIEIMVVVVVLLVAVTMAVPLFLNQGTVNRENITYKRIVEIKKAIVGDPEKIDIRSRVSFGFVGDLGVLPNDLSELMNQGAYPGFTTGDKISFGWHGPYLNDDVKLLDAWGRPIRCVDLDGDPATWDRRLYSVGPDGVDDGAAPGSDDIYHDNNPNYKIREPEVRNFVQGIIQPHPLSHLPTPTSDWQVNAVFPNGTGTPVTLTVKVNVTDAAYTTNPTRLPIGNRFFQFQGQPYQYQKLVALNGYNTSYVNFVTQPAPDDEENPGVLFERTFWNGDNTTDNQIDPLHIPDGGGVNHNPATGFMNFSPVTNGDIYVLRWGSATWDDYRVEVNAMNTNTGNFGIFYRMNNLAYVPAVDGNPPTIRGTGYMLEVDYTGSGATPCLLSIKKYEGATWTQVGSTVSVSASDLDWAFRGSAHQFSVTVDTEGGITRHHVRIDGIKHMEVSETDAIGTGASGLWVESGANVSLYHLLVHSVPTVPELPYVWWSFEEGPPTVTAYGFGYRDPDPTIIGTFENPSRIYRYGNFMGTNKHGQCIYVNASRDSYINCGDVMDFEADRAYTVSFWVRVPVFSLFRYYTAIGKKHQGNLRGWMVGFYTGIMGDLYAHFHLRQATNAEMTVLTRTPVLLNRWYHVAVRYDGTGYPDGTVLPTSVVSIYITPDTSDTLGTPTQYDAFSSSSLPNDADTAHDRPLYIGADYVQSGGGPWSGARNPFTGYIDEIKIFNRALSQPEIEALFQQDR